MFFGRAWCKGGECTVVTNVFPYCQVPSWLEEMIQFPTWRELFYQLAEQYPDCLMLKFTIKLVSDAGFQNEITSASTAQHQPEVFSGLVKSALLQIASGRVSEIEDHKRDFKVLCITCA